MLKRHKKLENYYRVGFELSLELGSATAFGVKLFGSTLMSKCFDMERKGAGSVKKGSIKSKFFILLCLQIKH